MSTPEHREVGRRLLEKANEDLSAAKALIAEDQADHVIGFHFQQAAEKALKALLAENAIEIPRTHDLAYLVEQLRDLELEIPEAVASCDWLTPYEFSSAMTLTQTPWIKPRALKPQRQQSTWLTGSCRPINLRSRATTTTEIASGHVEQDLGRRARQVTLRRSRRRAPGPGPGSSRVCFAHHQRT